MTPEEHEAVLRAIGERAVSIQESLEEEYSAKDEKFLGYLVSAYEKLEGVNKWGSWI